MHQMLNTLGVQSALCETLLELSDRDLENAMHKLFALTQRSEEPVEFFRAIYQDLGAEVQRRNLERVDLMGLYDKP